MNDDFLRQFRESPRPAFAHTLYAHISKEPKNIRPQVRLVNGLPLRSVLVFLGILILAAACTYVSVVPKWIAVGDGLWVQEKKSAKELLVGSEPPSAFLTMPLLNIEEAKTQANFQFKFPVWVPSGFDLEGASTLNESELGYQRVNIFWGLGNSANTFYKIAFQAYSTQTWMIDSYRSVSFGMYVGKKSTKLTQVNGVSAVLIHGDWDFQKTLDSSSSDNSELSWDKDVALQLLWREGEVVYRIYSVDVNVSAEDLIRMAESAR